MVSLGTESRLEPKSSAFLLHHALFWLRDINVQFQIPLPVSTMGVGQVEEEDQVGGPQSDWIMLWHSGTSASEKTKRRLLICVWNGLRAFVHCIHLFTVCYSITIVRFPVWFPFLLPQ